MLESDPSLRTDEVNMFRLTKRNHQFFNWWFFYDEKTQKRNKKTCKEKYLQVLSLIKMLKQVQ